MKTPAENLADAVSRVRDSFGFAPSGPIPREKLDDYFRALSEVIVAEPSLYSAQAVANAERYRAQGEFDPLDQTTIIEAGREFAGAFLDQAAKVGEGAAAIGEGVVSTAKLARYGIPLVVVLVVAAWLWKNVIVPAR
jgi:hypothetical protein